MSETRFQSLLYFIDSVDRYFIIQKLQSILQIGWGADLGWSAVRAAYQFKWW
jgi:hypothetical protein